MADTHDWSDVCLDYCDTWIKMNHPFYTQALEKLPDLEKNSILGVPGAGPGHELQMLSKKFKDCPLAASDPHPGMVNEANETIKKANLNNAGMELLGFDELQANVYNAAISFFAVHVTRNPLDSILKQFSSIKEGGWSCTVYFPPVPEEGGPLDGLYKSMRKLKPKDPPEWENELIESLMNAGARKVDFMTLNAEWKFNCRFDFRRAMELLPTFAAVKKHTNPQFYRNLWAVWINNHSLTRKDGLWRGPVAARMVVAYK